MPENNALFRSVNKWMIGCGLAFIRRQARNNRSEVETRGATVLESSTRPCLHGSKTSSTSTALPKTVKPWHPFRREATELRSKETDRSHDDQQSEVEEKKGLNTYFRSSETPIISQSCNSDLLGLTRRLRIGRLVALGAGVQISKMANSSFSQ